MRTDGGDHWTIDELGLRVAGTLAAAGYAGVSSGRVLRARPSPHDPLLHDARPALPARRVPADGAHGPRHLAELVAIKRLQEQGLSLAEVQRRLAGAPTAWRVSPGLEPGPPATVPARRESRFGG